MEKSKLVTEYSEMRNMIKYARIILGLALLKRTFYSSNGWKTMQPFFESLVKEFELLKLKQEEFCTELRDQFELVESQMDCLKKHLRSQSTGYLDEKLPNILRDWEAGAIMVRIK